jgi:hypothetical protein
LPLYNPCVPFTVKLLVLGQNVYIHFARPPNNTNLNHRSTLHVSIHQLNLSRNAIGGDWFD